MVSIDRGGVHLGLLPVLVAVEQLDIHSLVAAFGCGVWHLPESQRADDCDHQEGDTRIEQHEDSSRTRWCLKGYFNSIIITSY
jgi:hypothetical protein